MTDESFGASRLAANHADRPPRASDFLGWIGTWDPVGMSRGSREARTEISNASHAQHSQLGNKEMLHLDCEMLSSHPSALDTVATVYFVACQLFRMASFGISIVLDSGLRKLFKISHAL